MYRRLLTPPKKKSFFLFGPRGSGKTSWVQSEFPNALYLDLLEHELYSRLSADPGRLAQLIPPDFDDWIILDEVQRIPLLLNEVHRLIEAKKYRFILTGSSARALRRKGINLLAGRALNLTMHPFTATELGKDFSLERSLQYGNLPVAQIDANPKAYLNAYIATYLEEEVRHEGLARNLGAFNRFLEVASFSQGSPLNYSAIARECSNSRKSVAAYFDLLEDLLVGKRLPVFTKRARRKLVAHDKFYFFDVGIYRTIRPTGPLDTTAEGDGAALETLLFQELRALNDYLSLDYKLHYWRTHSGLEVDFVLYGPNGLHAFEIKRSRSTQPKDLNGLKAFKLDYPEAQLHLIYGGSHEIWEKDIHIIPTEKAVKALPNLLTTAVV